MLLHAVDKPNISLRRHLEEIRDEDQIILSPSPEEEIIGPPLVELTYEEAPLYERWDMSPVQYIPVLPPTNTETHALMTFSYEGIAEGYRARNTRVAYKLAGEHIWRTLQTAVDEQTKTIKARVPLFVERISFAYNTAWYSKFTQQLANEYPVWTHARHSKKSNAQQFLNFFGITLEEVESWIRWTQRQKYIMTADLKQIDYAFVYKIPDKYDMEAPWTITENINGSQLREIQDIHDFMKNSMYPGYFLDKETRQFFTRVNYSVLSIEQILQVDDEEMYIDDMLEPQMHHVWNTFDEFALLFDLKRLPNENNESLRERILDVFRYPAGAHYLGLIYGITRETNNMQRLVWADDTKPFYIKANNRKILPETLHIDHKHIQTYEKTKESATDETYKVYANGDIEIAPRHTGKSHTITFVADLFLFELHDKENDEVYPILFQDNGQATDKLRHWVKQINQLAPSMWGYTRWDVHHWDNIDKKGTGLGFIPNQYDTELDAWK